MSDLINAKSFAEFEEILSKNPEKMGSLLHDLMLQLIESGTKTINHISEGLSFIYSSMAAPSTLITNVQT